MHVYFPQWQGSGYSDEIRQGAEIIKSFYSQVSFVQIPLSEIEIIRKNNIIGYDALIEQLSRFRSKIEELRPDQIFTVGGDCGLEVVPVSYLNAKYTKKFAVLWLDAHADLNTPSESPSNHFHGMPVRTLLGGGDVSFDRLMFSTLSAHQVFYVGLRSLDDPERKYIDDNKIYHSSTIDVQELCDLIHQFGFEHLYIHLDLDILDPDEFAFTKYQVPYGVRISQVEELIKCFSSDFKVVGASVLESTTTDKKQLDPIKNILELIASNF